MRFDLLVTKHEGDFQSDFEKHQRLYLPMYFYQDHRNPQRAGQPDLSLTGEGKSIWIELKVSRKPPVLRKRGAQDITMARLAERGLARYVILTRYGLYMDFPYDVQNDAWYQPDKLIPTYQDLFTAIRRLHI
jgi:hypothetical protein